MIKRKRIAGLARMASVGILVGLLVAGCAADQACRTGRTGGWLSGWGSGGGASAFTIGLHRTWRDCADRTTGPARAPMDAGPVPSADPASEQPTSPSGSIPPR